MIPPTLSDRQAAVLDALGAKGAAMTPLQSVAPGSTITTLAHLGLVDVRYAGARDPFVHLTNLGRTCWAALNDCGPEPPTAVNRKEGTMPATATSKPAPAPDVEDVTGKPNEAIAKPDLQPLFKELLTAVKQAVSGAKQIEKPGYTRVTTKDGKTLAYVHKPSSKSVWVEVPANGKRGEIRAKTSEDVAKAVELVKAEAADIAAAKQAS